MAFTIPGKNNVGHTIVAKDGKFFAAFKNEDDARLCITLLSVATLPVQTLSEMEADDPTVFMTDEDVKKAFKAGMEAYKAGVHRDPGNPFPHSNSLHNDWDAGFLYAEQSE